MNNNYSFITCKDRAQAIVAVLENKVTVEPFDDESDRVTFTNVSNLDLLLLFHAGIKYGHTKLANVLGY
jgi:hypothetical protein